jgi:hypothetical protein
MGSGGRWKNSYPQPPSGCMRFSNAGVHAIVVTGPVAIAEISPMIVAWFSRAQSDKNIKTHSIMCQLIALSCVAGCGQVGCNQSIRNCVDVFNRELCALVEKYSSEMFGTCPTDHDTKVFQV